jgi:hypothetical protein
MADFRADLDFVDRKVTSLAAQQTQIPHTIDANNLITVLKY